MTNKTGEYFMEKFLIVPIDQVHISGTNPRKHFDAKKMEDLKESIRAKDIIQPLLVRPYELKTKKGYEIVAGERRYKAAMELGKLTVPIIARDLTDEQALEIQVIENLQREDVHPMEEAEGYQQLIDKNNTDVKEIAAKVGKSTTYVYQRLILLQLIADVKELYLTDKLNAHGAMLIARLPEVQQNVICEALVNELKYQEIITTSSITRRIDAMMCDLKKVPWKLNDPLLFAEAGACSTCMKRTGNNMELFDDVRQKDTCTDAICYGMKCDAFRNKKLEALKAKGDAVMIVTDYGKAPKGALKQNDYTISEKGEKNAIPGVVATGDDRGKVIYIIPKKSIVEMDEDEVEKEKKKIDSQQRNRRIAELTAEKFQKSFFGNNAATIEGKLTDEEWEIVCINEADDIEEMCRVLIDSNNTLPAKQSYWGVEGVRALVDAGYSYEAIVKVYRFYDETKANWEGVFDKKALEKWGKILKVDYSALMKKAKDEAKAEVKAEEKQKLVDVRSKTVKGKKSLALPERDENEDENEPEAEE
jgi:ParB/RepB/Spo0J family partition protein